MKTKVIPVIHVSGVDQALRNAERAYDAGADGVMFISMDGQNAQLGPIAVGAQKRFKGLKVGVNYLGWAPENAVKANLGLGLDMTWTDQQVTFSQNAPWQAAQRVQDALAGNAGHQVFVGVGFKHQAFEPDPLAAAIEAFRFGFVPTTSGIATGQSADVSKLQMLRAGLKDAPLAVASGVTPDNARDYAPLLSHILVATGVSSSFYELDYELLHRLVAIVR